jgi:CubicO group peptidase (beta-lactamase class C family)
MGLLGHLLARRAAVSYEQLVQERVADPLGMADTRITLTPDMQRRLAQGHAGTTPVSTWDIPTLAGAGALRSTAADMLTFLAANLGLVETPLHAAMVMTHEPRHEAGSPTMQIGLGWHIRMGDREIVWHNGGTGGNRAFIGFVTDTQTGVVVLTNTSTSADDIGFHLLDPTVPLREIRVPVTVARAVLERYVGRYEVQSGVVAEVGLDGEGLTVQIEGQQQIRLHAASETEFFPTVVDAQLTFTLGDGGDVTGFVLRQGGTEQAVKRLP